MTEAIEWSVWRWLTEIFNEWPEGRRPGRPASEGDRRPERPVSD